MSEGEINALPSHTSADDGSSAEIQPAVQLFLQLMTAHQHRIYGYVLSLVPQSSDADDIMQETTMIMWRKFAEFEKDTDFVSWAIQIARFCVLNYRQKNKRTVYLDEDTLQMIESLSTNPRAGDDDYVNALQQCVKKLVGRDQLIVRLRYGQELSVRNIAERIGRNDPFVYRILSRVHDMLFQCVNRTLRVWES